jgi:hypothetical protein
MSSLPSSVSFCSSLTVSGKACVNHATHFEGNCVVHHNYKRRHDPEYRARYTETPERKAKNKEHADREAQYAIGRLNRTSEPRYYCLLGKLETEHVGTITRSKHKQFRAIHMEAYDAECAARRAAAAAATNATAATNAAATAAVAETPANTVTHVV